MFPLPIMKDKMLIFITLFLISVISISLLCSCQHRIKRKDLEYPPEFDESGVEVSTTDPEEIERELEEIANMAYPPYTIQGGDTFRVRVYGEDDVSDGHAGTTSTVTSDGYLVLALIGPVYVAGLSLIEATDLVTKAFEEYIKYPRVALIPMTVRGKQATLLGAVSSTGVFSVREDTRLTEFISMGGGFATGLLDGKTVEMADIPSSYLIRDGKILPVNFSEAIYKGNPLHNIPVRPGDVVYIARRDSSRVFVMGEVNSPRQLNWTPDMTIVDTIALAGGLRDEHWGTALILRRSKGADTGAELNVYKVNINDLLSGRGRNFKVAAEDIVYIPKDSISEYNVFVRKLLPTAQLINAASSPVYWFNR